jgi:hypothetical protein
MSTTELQQSAPSILSLFETNKQQRASFVEAVFEQLHEGAIDPLKIHLQIKAMEDIINSLTNADEKKNKEFGLLAKFYKKTLLEAAEKYGKKFQLHNAEFSIKEVGTKYDFSQCGDTVHQNLAKEAEAINLKLKAREDYLKVIPTEGVVVTDEESGETIKIYPPSKSSTTSVAVSLK